MRCCRFLSTKYRDRCYLQRKPIHKTRDCVMTLSGFKYLVESKRPAISAAPASSTRICYSQHLTPISQLPQDDVLIPILPQTNYQHKYHFNANNKPGTYWYHAHLHGCTAFQVCSKSLLSYRVRLYDYSQWVFSSADFR